MTHVLVKLICCTDSHKHRLTIKPTLHNAKVLSCIQHKQFYEFCENIYSDLLIFYNMICLLLCNNFCFLCW